MYVCMYVCMCTTKPWHVSQSGGWIYTPRTHYPVQLDSAVSLHVSVTCVYLWPGRSLRGVCMCRECHLSTLSPANDHLACSLLRTLNALLRIGLLPFPLYMSVSCISGLVRMSNDHCLPRSSPCYVYTLSDCVCCFPYILLTLSLANGHLPCLSSCTLTNF